MIPDDTHLQIGSLLFDGLDQIDLTGPFEVLSRVPNSTYRIYAPSSAPVRDVRGLRILPDATLAEAPRLDVLHVPGGQGQEALMRDAALLGWLREQAAGAGHVLSVCTGALLLGAAACWWGGGRRPTGTRSTCSPGSGPSRWTPAWSSTATRTAAPGCSRPASPRGSTGRSGSPPRCAATRPPRAIQLGMQYAPEPPFDSGTPLTAPPAVVARARAGAADLTARREATARAHLRRARDPASPSRRSAPMNRPQNLAHVRAFAAAMQAKDRDGMLAEMTEDVVLNTPLAAEPVRGKAAIRPVVDALLATIDAFEIREILEGPTYAAAFFGAAAGPHRIDGADIWRLDADGLIREMSVLWRPLPEALAIRDRLFRAADAGTLPPAR